MICVYINNPVHVNGNLSVECHVCVFNERTLIYVNEVAIVDYVNRHDDGYD